MNRIKVLHKMVKMVHFVIFHHNILKSLKAFVEFRVLSNYLRKNLVWIRVWY